MKRRLKCLFDLVRVIEQDDWTGALAASDVIVRSFGRSATRSLIKLLKSDRVVTRNAAALALREIGDSRAVDPLFRAINNPNNRSDRATLVYALETLDCRNHFLDLIELAISEKADVQLSAMDILERQAFLVNDDDLNQARETLETCRSKSSFMEWFYVLEKRLADFDSDGSK